MYRVLITGGRDWTESSIVTSALDKVFWFCVEHNLTPVIVHGDCPTGADAIADEYARKRCMVVEPHQADWSQGRAAGPLRNQHMVSLGADICIAFNNGGRGTANCMKEARAAGIPLTVFAPDGSMTN